MIKRKRLNAQPYLLILVGFLAACNTDPNRNGGDNGDKNITIEFSSTDAVEAVEIYVERERRLVQIRKRVTRSRNVWISCDQIDFDLGRCSDVELYPDYGRKQRVQNYTVWDIESVYLLGNTRLVARQISAGSWTVEAEFSLERESYTSTWDVSESNGEVVDVVERRPAND